MAEYYEEFAQALPRLTADESGWLRRQLESICVFGDREYSADSLPADLDRAAANWIGPRFLRGREEGEDELGFEFEFHDASATDEARLTFFASDQGDPDQVAQLVQEFLRVFRPYASWRLSFACSCSKSRIDAFGGGAMFVTAESIRSWNTFDFLAEAETEFLASQNHDTLQKPSSGD